MIRHADPRAQAAIEAALRSENPAALTEWEFWAGNRNLDARVESLSYGREGDSIASALEANLAGALNPGIRSEDVTVDIIVAGIPTRRFTGRAHRPTNAGFRSKLLANTAGWWASGDASVKLGSEKRFAGYTPRRAAEEILLRLPYSGSVDIEQTSQETFVRGATEPFLKTEETKAVLDAVSSETKLVFTDTRLNGVVGRRPRPAPLSGDVVWTLRAGRDFDSDAFTYNPDPNEYRDVLAWRFKLDGTVEDLAYASIPGSTAPEGATYLIQIETEGVAAYAEAREKVNEAATNLIHGEAEWSLSLPWIHALLEEGDVVEIEDESDLILRRWLARVDLIGEDAYEKTQTLSGLGTYREERVAKTVPGLVGSGSAAVELHPFGGDWLDRTYFDLGSLALPFVTEDNGTPTNPRNDLVIDLDALPPGWTVRETETELIINDSPIPTGVLAGDERTIQRLGDYTIEEMS